MNDKNICEVSYKYKMLIDKNIYLTEKLNYLVDELKKLGFVINLPKDITFKESYENLNELKSRVEYNDKNCELNHNLVKTCNDCLEEVNSILYKALEKTSNRKSRRNNPHQYSKEAMREAIDSVKS